MQADFLCEILEKTASMHRIIETSGYGDSQKWEQVLKLVDFVYYDLKIMDDAKHKQYTGVSNALILKNAKTLFQFGVPFTIRVPFIHGVNTDEENLRALCEFVKDAPALSCVELLSYNELAGAKYKLVGLEYEKKFSKPTEADFALADGIFKEYGVNYIQER